MRNVTSISPSLYRCDFKAASQYSGISVRAVLTFQSKWSNFISVWQLSSALAKSYYVWHPRPPWFFTIRDWCFFGLLASSTGLILMSLLASQKKTDSFTLDKKTPKKRQSWEMWLVPMKIFAKSSVQMPKDLFCSCYWLFLWACGASQVLAARCLVEEFMRRTLCRAVCENPP